LGIFVCAARPFTGFKSTPPSDWNICCDGGDCDEWEKGAVEGRGLVRNDRIAPGYWWDSRGTRTKTGIRGGFSLGMDIIIIYYYYYHIIL